MCIGNALIQLASLYVILQFACALLMLFSIYISMMKLVLSNFLLLGSFQCPWKDSRDYHDWPDCNLAGNLGAIAG
jgi:hypothetical protein